MDTKQKYLLGLTAIALGFLGYQIFELVDRDITETPVLAEERAAQAPQPAVASATQSLPVMAVQPPKLNVANAHAIHMQDLTHTQSTYVNMLSQFELAKLHHQLADEEVAVASAQNKIADLHTKTKELVGDAGVNLIEGASPQQFSLSYVDQRDGQWSATLKMDGVYKSVQIGTNLPEGYQVTGIDHAGVTLQKDNHRLMVTFNGIVTLPDILHSVAAVQGQDLPPRAVPQVTKAAQLAHGVMSEQAQLLAMQLVQHGKEAQAIARQGLKTVPPQAALPAYHALSVHTKSQPTQSTQLQLSIDDQYAREDVDEMQDNQLSKDLHLRSVEIKPIVNEPYSTQAYLPQQDSLPQDYKLSMVQHSYVPVYAAESVDSEVPAANALTNAERRALKLPANRYTIQLIGSDNSDVVNQYIVDHHLQRKAIKLSIGDKQHPWSLALYGSYKTFDEAENVLVHLPPSMRHDGAWIRKVKDVQNILKRKIA